jgi:hypothetical protein
MRTGAQHRFPVMWLVAAAIAVSGIVPTAAGADIVGKGTPGQKQRRDIAKQWAKMWRCVAKATLACEADGGHSGLECDPRSATAVPPADPKGRYAAAIHKCLDKLDFGKHGSGDGAADYAAMGCPKYYGFSNNIGTVEALQSGMTADLRSLIYSTFLMIDSACPFSDLDTNHAARDCVAADAEIVIAYVTGLIRCQQECENDYSGKLGDGGRNNDQVCTHYALGAPSFLECAAKALAKATKKGAASNPSILPTLGGVYDTLNLAFFDSGCP